jgi:hypothetical protein
MRYSGHPPIPQPYIVQLQNQIAEAHRELKRGIDADWRASVLRYPVVLDYFYSLVQLRIPDPEDPRVVNPAFATPNQDTEPLVNRKKKKRRADLSQEQGPESRIIRRIRGPPPLEDKQRDQF